MKICVFCSSSNAVDDAYFETAETLGNILAQNRHTLIYGGANVGLMEHLAKAVNKGKAKVIGFIPQKIHDKTLASDIPDELFITQTMDQRKREMRDMADAFIALPGGFGTLEEILEVITLKQLDYHQKPIVFINTNNFYEHLILQFEKSYTEMFANPGYRKLYKIVNTPEEAIEYFSSYQLEEMEHKWYNVPQKTGKV
ncbi:MAG: TIGR00730 family Rossman fold protein [Prolixibacteraceae bacterium]|nr:TIGR00730 family Rossman fold protein [Prolixibacteraceae bacterium]